MLFYKKITRHAKKKKKKKKSKESRSIRTKLMAEILELSKQEFKITRINMLRPLKGKVHMYKNR